MKRFLSAFFALAMCLSISLWGDDAGAVLPHSFAGWTQSGPARTAAQPGTEAALFQEYGFTGSETATYTSADGRKLTLRADRFNDATGAYGAFTFSLDPAMKLERIGTQAAAAEDRVVFFRSNIVVDAQLDRPSSSIAADLRQLAAMLPQAKGTAANLPRLPDYLPKKGAVQNSAKYALGPQGLALAKTPIAPELVDFRTDPEILAQEYTTDAGPVLLTLIQYPTPQIATERLRALQASSAANNLAFRRVGPIVVAESGQTGSDQAKELLNAVTYEAEVTWNEATSMSKRDNVGNLLVAVFGLIGILLLVGVIFGVFFGGIRVLMTKLLPGTIFDLPESIEIVQLHLEESSKPPSN